MRSIHIVLWFDVTSVTETSILEKTTRQRSAYINADHVQRAARFRGLQGSGGCNVQEAAMFRRLQCSGGCNVQGAAKLASALFMEQFFSQIF